MMKIGQIQRKKGFDYKIDRQGNIIESKYDYFKDPYTYLTILIALMAFLYYTEVKTARQFVGSECVRCCMLDKYVQDVKAEYPNVRLSCDCKTNKCEFSGIMNKNLKLELKNMNLSI